MNKYDYYQLALEKKREQKEYRQLRCVSALEDKGNANQLNFASNDVLGLSRHPYVKKNTIKYVLEWGAGTTPNRLVTEHLECHRSVEEKLSALVGKETALLFPSAYRAHEQILSTLMHERCMIFIDRYCHHGLIQAAIGSGAQVFRYEHNNLKQLEALLEKANPSHQKWIMTESLFGIDGETASLKQIAELAHTYGALTYVDDSYSVGVLGKHGMGLASHRKGIDVVFGSFGKQTGTFGAFLATNHLFRNYLLAFNPELLETTMLPPAGLGAISGSLDLIPDMHVERQKIEMLSQKLRELLQENHWDVGQGKSHLIPLLCSKESECLKLSNALLKANILVTTLRPPFVPQGAMRLRFTLNAHHRDEDLKLLVSTLQNLREEPSLSVV
ncbi:MAG: aminotransferase class I/II-fold pyridoxal phosphate-dependent enzyme [Chlamydiia bacterium]|nr:aminotransferase class I/II-fold pyridoxal phosphate-dependent enzyme [Chlamydiia bacterium]